MTNPWTSTIALLVALVSPHSPLGPGHAQGPRASEAKASLPNNTPAVLVVIVNPKNPTANLSMRELRSYFKLERQSWPDNVRTELWLRSSAQEDQILLDRVYSMSKRARKKYFRGRSNRGEIHFPSFVPSASVAGKKVAGNVGAFSVVMSNEIPVDGVKVLLIDGKKPDDVDYPLTLLGTHDT